jgi:hypothetical protein
MAPELAQGLYAPRSDIYALGCVLLELLSGMRVGPTTAAALEDAADEDEGSAAAVCAVAEACWPAPAAAALSELVLACIHHKIKKRPAGMAEVLAALKGIRALVAPTAPPLVPCPVCMEDVPEAGGLRCSAAPPAGSHFICHGCLQEHVRTKVEALAALRESGGAIPCHVGGCKCMWGVEDLQDSLDKGTLVKIVLAMRRMAIDGPREAAEMTARQAAALAAAAQMALAERVAELRRVIVERDLLLRCPQCAAEFDDYNGCELKQQCLIALRQSMSYPYVSPLPSYCRQCSDLWALRHWLLCSVPEGLRQLARHAHAPQGGTWGGLLQQASV